MRQDDYWEKFMGSGKIADYLEFRGIHASKSNGGYAGMQDITMNKSILQESSNHGMEEHAGFSDCYGNGNQIDSGRGI